YYSEADNTEGWPSTNAFTFAETPEFGTAVIPADSFQYICFRNATYRFTYSDDPAEDGNASLVAYRGSINNRTWARIGETLYVMDHLGIYAMSQGAQEAAFPVRDLFSLQSTGAFKIDWTMAEHFHAVADPENASVYFFVSLGGPVLPRFAICYNYLTQQFWL